MEGREEGRKGGRKAGTEMWVEMFGVLSKWMVWFRGLCCGLGEMLWIRMGIGKGEDV